MTQYNYSEYISRWAACKMVFAMLSFHHHDFRYSWQSENAVKVYFMYDLWNVMCARFYHRNFPPIFAQMFAPSPKTTTESGEENEA